MPCNQFLDPCLEPAAADLANLQAITTQDATDAELYIEQLSLGYVPPSLSIAL